MTTRTSLTILALLLLLAPANMAMGGSSLDDTFAGSATGLVGACFRDTTAAAGVTLGPTFLVLGRDVYDLGTSAVEFELLRQATFGPPGCSGSVDLWDADWDFEGTQIGHGMGPWKFHQIPMFGYADVHFQPDHGVFVAEPLHVMIWGELLYGAARALADRSIQLDPDTIDAIYLEDLQLDLIEDGRAEIYYFGSGPATGARAMTYV